MQTLHPALLLHFGALLLFAAALVATLVVPQLRRYAGLAPIPLLASVLLLLRAGWWIDMPARVTALGLLLLLPWAACHCWAEIGPAAERRPASRAARLLADSARLLYAGFFLALAVQSLRNDTPLAPPLAFGILLLGGLLLLRPGKSRLVAALALLLLLATVLAGIATFRIPGGTGQAGFGAMIISICRPSMRGNCSILA